MDITDKDINFLVPEYILCNKLYETGLFDNSKLVVNNMDGDIFYSDRTDACEICAPMLCEIIDVLVNMLGKTNIHLDTIIYGTKCNSIKVDTFNPYFFEDKNIHASFDGKGSFFLTICEIFFKVYSIKSKNT